MNTTPLGRFTPQCFALLRIVSGLLFAIHGSQKILGWPPSEMGKARIASMIGVGGLIELICGLLLVVGFLTGWAAFLASGEMAVAYWFVHVHAGQHNGWIPLVNKGELAVVYCFLFLYIAAHGAGIWSIDNGLSRRR